MKRVPGSLELGTVLGLKLGELLVGRRERRDVSVDNLGNERLVVRPDEVEDGEDHQSRHVACDEPRGEVPRDVADDDVAARTVSAPNILDCLGLPRAPRDTKHSLTG